MAFELPPLPYAQDALTPHLSAQTLGFHHGKHHAAYVNKLNELTQGTELASWPLERVILETAKDPARASIFNNAAQVFNHTFFWSCMQPGGGGEPTGRLRELLEAKFGSVAKFKEEFKAAAVGQFGSGWAWLVLDGAGELAIRKTGNAGTPLVDGEKLLLTVDVWEHAYYLDFQNRRPDWVQTFLDSLVSWESVARNL